MRGYPKHINCKQDFLNLLEMPEHRERALKDLQKRQALDDSKVVRVVSGSEEEKNLVTEIIDNPMPVWKQKGFESRAEAGTLITENGGEL